MKMKLVKLAHPSQVREVGPGDLDRLLAQGWVEIKKPVNRNARKQRLFRQRRKLLGQKRIAAYLDMADAEALLAARLPGETVAQLLMRLLRVNSENHIPDRDK
ncbi:hypothetical protein NVV94_05655 [Pseudomonas sp. LS1212]|uniref:hypothetical protein n=1 Tax=Pseudomonas sp. LS1212 TaxID=2972478 RepID=UPI00215CD687|nr:hypothetical protein [Pseudomonas sp. LS1212]UVJ45067.1 hypothetical protein NVV94_05655 [Pseudomonas sp. LS1212]